MGAGVGGAAAARGGAGLRAPSRAPLRSSRLALLSAPVASPLCLPGEPGRPGLPPLGLRVASPMVLEVDIFVWLLLCLYLILLYFAFFRCIICTMLIVVNDQFEMYRVIFC